jgi:hypothetical protein
LSNRRPLSGGIANVRSPMGEPSMDLGQKWLFKVVYTLAAAPS